MLISFDLWVKDIFEKRFYERCSIKRCIFINIIHNNHRINYNNEINIMRRKIAKNAVCFVAGNRSLLRVLKSAGQEK
jgi:hypothetical protein